MPATIEIFGATIVALGAFAPAAFTPDWLEKHQLIGKDDAEAARTSENFIVSQQVSQFETEWFQLQMLQSQFMLSNKGAVGPTLRDLAAGMFSLIPEVPVSAIGLNFFAHYKFANIQECHLIGDTLAPKKFWEELYPGEKESAGLLDLTMAILPFKREEKRVIKDVKRITVQPSQVVRENGIFFTFNDHHVIESVDGQAETAAEKVAKIINEYWDKGWKESTTVFDGLIERALHAQQA